MAKSKPTRVTEHEQMLVDLGLGKEIVANFDGGKVCSDGGLLLAAKADRGLALTELAALCVGETRRADLVQHSMQNLFQQRIYAILAGHEDCNDAAHLRTDAMHKLAVGRLLSSTVALASQPTLSRWENSIDSTSVAALQRLLVHIFVRTRKKPPAVLRLYMDGTEDEVHGYQQMSFYNGYYETYCYTPLFIFADCGFPLCALLRQGNAGAAEGALRMLKQILNDIKLSWPNTRIELVADAGFSLPEIYEYCEKTGITYFIGDGSHAGYAYHSEGTVRECKALFEELGGPVQQLKKYAIPVDPKAKQRAWRQREERIRFSSKSEGRMQEHFEDEDLLIRRYCEFEYSSREWSHARRIIARCQYTAEGPDVRYIITNRIGGKAKDLYEKSYCPRAKCENWIKELKNYLKCDRTSCQEFDANQFRLLLHTFAYILLWEVRRKAGMRASTVQTVQLQLIKVGVLVKETAQKVWLHLASEHPRQKEFRTAWLDL
jgi:DDE family transposase